MTSVRYDKAVIDEAVRNLDNLLIACDQSGREAWQTLKAIVLAQQTNNSDMVPCPTCGAACSIGGDDEEDTHYFIPVVSFRASASSANC